MTISESRKRSIKEDVDNEDLEVLRNRIKELEVIESESHSTRLYLDILGHDINNLNQAIISYHELLMVKPGIPEESKQYIKKSLEQAKAISNLITMMKTYTNIQNKEFEMENINVTKMFNEVFQLMNTKYPVREIQFNHIMEENKIFVNSSNLLPDVIENILDYIIKFDPYEKVSIDIAHKLSKDQKYWKFEFLNSTSYIYMYDFEKTLNEHIKEHSKSPQGFGLGLIIVHEIIRRCGGRVWIEDTGESSPHRGNKFIIMLPKGELT
jgi:light-regulated signal transduction histidine kinase (bacteriophytochrome)